MNRPLLPLLVLVFITPLLLVSTELPFRQVHLDFHTSAAIPDVAGEFDPESFAGTLAAAHVNSVTCFGRGHHGWIYYDSKQFPERVHPHLTRPNLLLEQIEACHARGIRVPIYITVQWDHYTSSRHPEWVIHNADGSLHGAPRDALDTGFYKRLCLNTPYVDFLRAHLTELFDLVPVDGLFLDIVGTPPCYCEYCQAGMQEAGLDRSDAEAVAAYAREVGIRFRREMTAFIRTLDDDCSIFYNGGHIGPGIRPVMDAYTHFEVESLPGGHWGYLHFPLTMRYVRTLGPEAVGMTGKFHTTWGDFHSFKNPAALQFECFNMLALGGKCSIGDQLHPSGRLDPATYRLIGDVYREVEAKEPWCRKAEPVVDLALFSPEPYTAQSVPESAAGAVRMLQELHHPFNVIDRESDFGPYKAIILPDVITFDAELAEKFEAYLAGGGAVLATYKSGLRSDETDFALPAVWGVRRDGEGPREPGGEPVHGRSYPRNNFADYILPEGVLGRGLERTEHVMYMRGLPVVANEQGTVLAHRVLSYFDRAGERFSSHQQTPSAGIAGSPAAVRQGRVIYFSHPLFTQYHRNAPRWCRTLFGNALAELVPDPLLRVEAPSTLLATVNEQRDPDRWVVHLLHYIPERRGRAFDVIEDVIPLHDVAVELRAPAPPKRVLAVPAGQPLPFEQRQGRVRFVLPVLEGHQMVALEFGTPVANIQK